MKFGLKYNCEVPFESREVLKLCSAFLSKPEYKCCEAYTREDHQTWVQVIRKSLSVDDYIGCLGTKNPV